MADHIIDRHGIPYVVRIMLARPVHASGNTQLLSTVSDFSSKNSCDEHLMLIFLCALCNPERILRRPNLLVIRSDAMATFQAVPEYS